MWCSGYEPACHWRICKKGRFDPWVRKTPWKRKWNPLQYLCLENSMDRGARRATVHGVAKNRTWLSTHIEMPRWKKSSRLKWSWKIRRPLTGDRLKPQTFIWEADLREGRGGHSGLLRSPVWGRLASVMEWEGTGFRGCTLGPCGFRGRQVWSHTEFC